MAFTASKVASEPWAILTHIFVHSPTDYMHLLNNLFFLTVFGTITEHYIGSRNFAILFLSSGAVASLSAFVYYPGSMVLGASGAISGIVAFLAVLKPRRVGLFWGVPLPMWAVLVGWIATNLAGVGSSAGIAFEAHLFGLLFGAFTSLVYRTSRPSSRKRASEIKIDRERIRRWEERYLM
ncbi:MAG: rhomboid family intramembrane serine protease [Candidatus Nanohaloarchaea archaeon]|nr:rhomboid family intramembrane serine protease [Candidatus Nanohaloarchaea archaeon]